MVESTDVALIGAASRYSPSCACWVPSSWAMARSEVDTVPEEDTTSSGYGKLHELCPSSGSNLITSYE